MNAYRKEAVMKVLAKLMPCLIIIMLMTALIVAKSYGGKSNIFLGFSSLSTSISYQTTK